MRYFRVIFWYILLVIILKVSSIATWFWFWILLSPFWLPILIIMWLIFYLVIIGALLEVVEEL